MEQILASSSSVGILTEYNNNYLLNEWGLAEEEQSEGTLLGLVSSDPPKELLFVQ